MRTKKNITATQRYKSFFFIDGTTEGCETVVDYLEMQRYFLNFRWWYYYIIYIVKIKLFTKMVMLSRTYQRELFMKFGDNKWDIKIQS